jgi:hypothetical protein
VLAPNSHLVEGSSTSLLQPTSTAWECMHCGGEMGSKTAECEDDAEQVVAGRVLSVPL